MARRCGRPPTEHDPAADPLLRPVPAFAFDRHLSWSPPPSPSLLARGRRRGAGVEDIGNVLANYGVSGQPVGRTAKSVNGIRGNALVDVIADTGGFVAYLLELNAAVEAE